VRNPNITVDRTKDTEYAGRQEWVQILKHAEWNMVRSEHGLGYIEHTAGRSGIVCINMAGPGLERIAWSQDSEQESRTWTVNSYVLMDGRTRSSCMAGGRQEQEKVNPMGSRTGLTKKQDLSWVLRKGRV
jgi:hypothetical protein